ncbi:MAG: chloride channel protein [Oscillospiraceae bacterium]
MKIYNNEKFELIKTYIKWCFISVIIGIILGLVGVSFHYAIDISAKLFSGNRIFLFLLPVTGAIIPLMYKLSGMEKDVGTNMAILSIRENQNISIKTAPLIFISTVLTHLTGGSAGREGAALQLGSSIGGFIGKIFKLDQYDKKIITMCGMSAAFAALFGTPITASIFAIEMIGVGVMHYSALVPCTVSAIIAALVARFFNVPPAFFALKTIPELTIINLLKIIVLSALCALISIVFCFTIHYVGKIYKKIPNTILRGAIGGVIVLVVSLLLGTNDYNGAGMSVISRAISGEAFPLAFLIKIALTALTLGAGFKGGEIVPTFFTGATFGCVAASFIGIDNGFGAAIGLISLFCGVTNCPLASIFLSLELFGEKGIIFFAIACATSFMLSGYSGLYNEQIITYSKTKPIFINRKAD